MILNTNNQRVRENVFSLFFAIFFFFGEGRRLAVEGEVAAVVEEPLLDVVEGAALRVIAFEKLQFDGLEEGVALVFTFIPEGDEEGAVRAVVFDV